MDGICLNSWGNVQYGGMTYQKGRAQLAEEQHPMGFQTPQVPCGRSLHKRSNSRLCMLPLVTQPQCSALRPSSLSSGTAHFQSNLMLGTLTWGMLWHLVCLQIAPCVGIGTQIIPGFLCFAPHTPNDLSVVGACTLACLQACIS